MRNVPHWLVIVGIGLLVLTSGALYVGASGHGPRSTAPSGRLAHLPEFVQTASPAVQNAYLYAIAHPDILREIPCYCGCMKALGHRHNLDCYVTKFEADGSIAQFDDHGAYCVTCINITQVVATERQAGKSVAEIRALINAQYGYPAPATPMPS